MRPSPSLSMALNSSVISSSVLVSSKLLSTSRISSSVMYPLLSLSYICNAKHEYSFHLKRFSCKLSLLHTISRIYCCLKYNCHIFLPLHQNGRYEKTSIDASFICGLKFSRGITFSINESLIDFCFNNYGDNVKLLPKIFVFACKKVETRKRGVESQGSPTEDRTKTA